MEKNTNRFREIACKELKNDLSQLFLSLLSAGLAILRQKSMSSFTDPDAAVELARAIRGEVMERMPDLLEEFEKNAVSHGAKVLWARDARAANNIILDIAKQRNVAYVTKGKSMMTEEIGLNDYLITNGVDAFETDLGEVITQLLSLPPFHIVGPALNIPPEEKSCQITGAAPIIRKLMGGRFLRRDADRSQSSCPFAVCARKNGLRRHFMEYESGRKLNKRALMALIALISSVGLLFTGWAIHLLHSNYLSDAFHRWMVTHGVLGIIFTVSSIWHVILNRKGLLNHIRYSEGKIVQMRKEVSWAIALVGIMLTLVLIHTFFEY